MDLPVQAIPSYSARKALFEHYVKTRADEERKEKRAAQKAAVEGFKQLLEEAKEVYLVTKLSLVLFKCNLTIFFYYFFLHSGISNIYLA